MDSYDRKTIAKVEEQLGAICPSPENELTQLGLLAADLPDTEEGARVRLLALDVDDLVSQARWHLGQALFLMETRPHLLTIEQPPADPIQRGISENIIPSKALLLLRGYIMGADQVLFSDLAQPRRGGTAAGWVFHMMIDNAIYRVIAALDRLAKIVWYAADLPLTYKNGKGTKVYFRGRKIDRIDAKLGSEQSKTLLGIATGPLLEYVTDYRDGLAHDFKAYSKIAGARPTDEWTGADGKRVQIQHARWDAEGLFALGNATYHLLAEALPPAVAICRSAWAQDTALDLEDA